VNYEPVVYLRPQARARACASAKAILTILGGLAVLGLSVGALFLGVGLMIFLADMVRGANLQLQAAPVSKDTVQMIWTGLLSSLVFALLCGMFIAAYRDVLRSCLVAVELGMPWYYWLQRELRETVAQAIRDREPKPEEPDYVAEYLAGNRALPDEARETVIRDYLKWEAETV